MKPRLLAAVLVACTVLWAIVPAQAADDHGAAGHSEGHAAEHHESPFQLWKVLVVQGLAVLLVFLALKKWAFPIMSKALNDRIAGIRDRYEALEKEKSEVQRLQRDIRERLAGIEAEAKARVDAAVREGESQKAAIVSDAGAAADRLLNKARAEIEIERAKAVEEIRQEMVRLSLEAAERIVREQLSPARQEELIEKFIGDLEKVKS